MGKEQKVKEGCHNCKHQKERTVRDKECLRGFRATYGFGCLSWEKKEEVK